MTGTAPLSLDRASEQVEGMLDQGRAFEYVEEAIEATRFSQHHKAALWLLAWSLQDPAVQRRDAGLMAAAFVADLPVPRLGGGERSSAGIPSGAVGNLLASEVRSVSP